MTLAVDFDGVIHDWTKPVPGRKMGSPIPGSKDALDFFKRRGWEIIIHSCNNPRVIEEFMTFYDLPFDLIWTKEGKPVADFYIDDNALRFKGDWNETIEDLLQALREVRKG